MFRLSGKVRHILAEMPRPWKRAIQVAFDFGALFGVAWASYALRLGADFLPNPWQFLFILVAPVIAIPFFVRLGLYRAILRYLPDRIAWTIVQAMSLATLLWVALVFLAAMYGGQGVPRSVPVFYWALGILVIGGSRFAMKTFLAQPLPHEAGTRRALIYGAGRAGTQLAAALRAGGDGSVVGFLDDSPFLRGQDVAGLRVFSPDELPELIETLEIRDVILCIPSASAGRRMEIAAELARHPVTLRILPSITEIAAGKYSVGALKEIDIEDLLGRASVAPDLDLIRSVVSGKRIVITGAGGSIGSELCRLVARHGPREMVLVEASELALYEINRRLRTDAPGLRIVPLLASVADADAMAALFRDHAVDVLLHAAAYKHVPLLEDNPLEGVRNNVLGTWCVAQAAYAAGVKRFVLISTDKAVHPTSVMGATKRWSELIVRHLADRAEAEATGQRFLAVRFGNVLGSTGSVVPLFKEQIAAGGPVTVTHEKMTRYFMAIPEAAQLIVQAAALSEGGEIFLLDMGEPVSIRALAENMIRLAGLTVRSAENPAGDIEIQFTGIRPGEKLTESLYYDPTHSVATLHPKIFKAKRRYCDDRDLVAAVRDLESTLAGRRVDEVRRVLFDFIRERESSAA